MKKLSPLLFIIVLAFTACKKEVAPVTKPVDFTSTTYATLGAYDTSGKPTYLETRDVISAGLMSFAKNTLPEQTDLRVSNPELLTTKAIADIIITQSSEVSVTFVSQGSTVTNAIAFYTYPTNNPPATAKDIKTITYVFPNAGYRTTLRAGDKVKIGRFDVGTSIGFVLLREGWNPVTKKINNEAVHFCSNDVLNPEVDPTLKKHAVLINYPAENKVLIGFENVNRTLSSCDHDFNDTMIYTTVTRL
jgi:hypothetical protein